MRRRDFIVGLGGATAMTLVARAQQSEAIRRVGVFAPYAPDDPHGNARIAAFRKGLEHLGWIEGRNVAFLYRHAPAGERARDLAKELMELQPDVILAISPPVIAALQQERRENSHVPIVFIGISDPIGGGLVSSLAKPGGNLTGVLNYEPDIIGKWLAMLKEMAPHLSRATFLGNPKTTAFDYYFRASEAPARSLAMDIVPNRVADAREIERSLATFANVPNGGLVVLPDATAILHRDLILKLAEQHRIPAVFPFRFFVTAGGLMSYGTIDAAQFRQVSSLVDRVLRGARPADLPVQAPVKYETVINVRAARAIGLMVPSGLLVAADEVIE
jgi:putative ABC transport system substrate-binding protein